MLGELGRYLGFDHVRVACGVFLIVLFLLVEFLEFMPGLAAMATMGLKS